MVKKVPNSPSEAFYGTCNLTSGGNPTPQPRTCPAIDQHLHMTLTSKEEPYPYSTSSMHPTNRLQYPSLHVPSRPLLIHAGVKACRHKKNLFPPPSCLIHPASYAMDPSMASEYSLEGLFWESSPGSQPTSVTVKAPAPRTDLPSPSPSTTNGYDSQVAPVKLQVCTSCRR